MLTDQRIHDAVGRRLVPEAPPIGVDEHDPSRQVGLVDAVEARVQQPEPAVVSPQLRADLPGEIDGVAS